ncbi:cobalamin biosynthesis protein, partial [Mycobacterium avium]
MLATHPLGVLIGYLADRALGDPRRGHPVALFGRAVAGLENLTYRDGRVAGALHVGVSIGAVGLLGLAVHRAAARAGPRWSIAATAAAGWVCSGGTSLTRTGLAMAELL